MANSDGPARQSHAQLLITLLALATAVLPATAFAEGTVKKWIESFAKSDIEFARGESNAPFVPISWLEVTHYSDTEVNSTALGVQPLSYDQTVISQAAGIPFLLSERDMFVVGEWFNYSEFDVRSSTASDFDVTSVAIPLGWMRQNDPQWQTIAFVMPLGSNSSLPGGSWDWEYMGGFFRRYVKDENLWWVFGIFADVDPDDVLILPYVGASWIIDEEWTISAILPWPSVIYAPTQDTVFQFGFSPSGTSFGLDSTSGRVTYSLNAIDMGLSAEHRVYRNFWAKLEVGVSGFRALQLDGSDIDGLSINIDSSTFVQLGINFRPSMTPIVR